MAVLKRIAHQWISNHFADKEKASCTDEQKNALLPVRYMGL
jgi:hypothetical protein